MHRSFHTENPPHKKYLSIVEYAYTVLCLQQYLTIFTISYVTLDEAAHLTDGPFISMESELKTQENVDCTVYTVFYCLSNSWLHLTCLSCSGVRCHMFQEMLTPIGR